MIFIPDWALYGALAVVSAAAIIIRTLHFYMVARRKTMIAVIGKNACQALAFGTITYRLYGQANHVHPLILLGWMMYLCFFIANLIFNLLDLRAVRRLYYD